MSANHAVVVDPDVAGRLALREVAAPAPAPSEALVRVAAISLNRGELRRAASAQPGWRPGWDLAGTVEQPAADGSGPRKGARVVGMLGSGAWAELVAVPTNILAEIPDNVSFAQAATLPVAGLTALRALEKGGLLLDQKVLITGASGGVGHFACQLAHRAGAEVTGVVSQPEREAFVRQAGAHHVAVGEDLSTAQQFGPYHLILESVGGKSLSSALSMLAPEGTCVLFGTSSTPEITFDARAFYLTGGATLYGFYLFHELERRPGAEDLSRLARMIAAGQLHPQIDVEAPWTQIANIAQQLIDRRFAGKAVLHLTS
ncbi:MAG TPA: zinc-binding dehydrogenase [Ktedonobacteraceae bacterium]|jgi:NADPH:quinone reductase-like Zn-dependent oxidoreductase|nr:zinc-binding dehydrogenase [Ktedonobacteraceae bacterium]